MPVIEVAGIPDGTPGLIELETRLQRATAHIALLELREDQVTVLLLKTLRQPEPSQIIIRVSLLYDLPRRTPEVRQGLAHALCGVARSFAQRHMPGIALIEVHLDPPFRPEQGYSKWTPGDE